MSEDNKSPSVAGSMVLIILIFSVSTIFLYHKMNKPVNSNTDSKVEEKDNSLKNLKKRLDEVRSEKKVLGDRLTKYNKARQALLDKIAHYNSLIIKKRETTDVDTLDQALADHDIKSNLSIIRNKEAHLSKLEEVALAYNIDYQQLRYYERKFESDIEVAEVLGQSEVADLIEEINLTWKKYDFDADLSDADYENGPSLEEVWRKNDELYKKIRSPKTDTEAKAKAETSSDAKSNQENATYSEDESELSRMPKEQLEALYAAKLTDEQLREVLSIGIEREIFYPAAFNQIDKGAYIPKVTEPKSPNYVCGNLEISLQKIHFLNRYMVASYEITVLGRGTNMLCFGKISIIDSNKKKYKPYKMYGDSTLRLKQGEKTTVYSVHKAHLTADNFETGGYILYSVNSDCYFGNDKKFKF